MYLTSLVCETRHGADRTLLDNQGMSALDHAQQVHRIYYYKVYWHV